MTLCKLFTNSHIIPGYLQISLKKEAKKANMPVELLVNQIWPNQKKRNTLTAALGSGVTEEKQQVMV